MSQLVKSIVNEDKFEENSDADAGLLCVCHADASLVSVRELSDHFKILVDTKPNQKEGKSQSDMVVERSLGRVIPH